MRPLELVAALTFLGAPAAFAAEKPKVRGPSAGPLAAPADARVPYLGEAGQRQYQEYRSRPLPRAFAISESGQYGFASGTNPKNKGVSADPKQRALKNCRQRSRSECVLYSVDDTVVFSRPTVAAVPGAPPPPEGAPGDAPPPPQPSSALAPAPEPAQSNPAPRPPPLVTWVFEITGDIGINELYHIIYQDGSKQSVNANTGLGASLGVSALPLAGGRLRTRATLGVKGTFQQAKNGKIDYYAFPLEALETLELGPIRLGAGLYALLGPSLAGSGIASNITTKFDSTAGFEGRVEWVFGRKMGVGLRYVWNGLSSQGRTITSAPAFGFMLTYNGWVGD